MEGISSTLRPVLVLYLHPGAHSSHPLPAFAERSMFTELFTLDQGILGVIDHPAWVLIVGFTSCVHVCRDIDHASNGSVTLWTAALAGQMKWTHSSATSNQKSPLRQRAATDVFILWQRGGNSCRDEQPRSQRKTAFHLPREAQGPNPLGGLGKLISYGKNKTRNPSLNTIGCQIFRMMKSSSTGVPSIGHRRPHT